MFVRVCACVCVFDAHTRTSACVVEKIIEHRQSTTITATREFWSQSSSFLVQRCSLGLKLHQKFRWLQFANLELWITTHCNTLQHTATHCITLQHTASHGNTLQHTATHCNTLQHTATLCNTLQHTAIQSSTEELLRECGCLIRSCTSFFAKEPQIIRFFCRKRTVRIRHPMGLRHPV